MTAVLAGSRDGRLSRMAVAFSLAVSLVTIPAGPARAATDTYADDFSTGFSGSTGNLPWTTDWIEWGEADGPAAGALQVGTEPHCPGGGSDSCLFIGKGGPAEVALEREIDLSRAATATLEFSMDRHIHAGGTDGTVELSVSSNGGIDWAPLETWDLSVDLEIEFKSYDLAGFLGPNTRIQFRQYGGGSDSHVNIDNLIITAENDLSIHAGGIVINEVLFDQSPAGDEEFVELFNATTAAVSLAGWSFDNRAGNTFYTFPPGASIGPEEYAVVWIGTHEPGGLRDAPQAAFQDGAGEISNFFWDNGDAIWLHDAFGQRVDFVAWGTGSPSPPPEWDGSFETAYDGSATARGQSISLTPNGIDGNDSACWEPTTSGDATGRCAGYLPTADIPPAAQLWTPGYSNQGPPPNSPPAFGQDLPDRADSEGALISISAGATDPDLSNTLTYTATGLPGGISLNATTGLISGALGPNSSGIHPVTITVSDNGIPNEQDIDTFTWTVSPGEVAYLVANSGGGNGGDDLLTAVDLSDPSAATNEIDIGTGTGTWNIEAIALQPGTDTLFGIEDDQLGTIDVTTGRFTALPSVVGAGNGAVGLITFDDIEGLSFNPFTGHLYAAHRRGAFVEDVLLRIDPGTGAAIPGVFGGNDYITVQQTGGFHHVADLAFDPTDGQLYGIHWTILGAFSLARIDPETGATSTVGAVPSGVYGLAFDGAGGLWGTTADTFGTYSRYQFEKTNASVISTVTIDNGGNYESIAIAFPFSPNQPPAFDQDIIDQIDPEGTAISVPAGATDPDPGDLLTYTASGLPPGVVIDPASGIITGTLAFTASGTYPVTVTVTDNGIPNLADTDTFTWTVTNLNRAPVFDQDLLDRTDAEGTIVSVSAAATDPDPGDILDFEAVGLPTGLSIDPGSGLITGTLAFTASGTYPVTITVTDDGVPDLNDIDTFTWTITNTNRPPVVVNPGAQTTPELAPFSLAISASDPDLTIPSLSDGGTLPAWATLIDNLDGTATISGTPGAGDSATTTVTITATDGLLTDDAAFNLTITNTNRPPVVDPISDQTIAETAPFLLVVSAGDPDLTVPFINVAGLPDWASFSDNLDGTATIMGTPGYEDAGGSLVTITATDDGPLSASGTFTLTVTNTNRAPVMDPVPDQTGAENTAFSVTVSASDPDTTIPTFTATGLPPWATITDNGNGTATVAGTPGYNDAGTTTITITATDGLLTDDAAFTLTITNTNRPPKPTDDVLLLPADAASVTFSVLVNDTDPDGEALVIAAFESTTVGSLLDEGGGTFRYEPGAGAPYAETFTYTIADPGGATASAEVFISVSAAAALPPIVPPVLPRLAALAPVDAIELERIDFDAVLAEAGDVAFRLVGAPAGAQIDPATGAFSWTPSEAQGPGNYTFAIRIVDASGMVLDETRANVRVAELDTAPRLRPLDPTTAEPGTELTIVVIADDPDLPAQAPRFELVGPVPEGATIDSRTGRLSWSISSDELIGRRQITVRVTDELDAALHDEVTLVVTVGARSSSDRKAALVSQLITPTGTASAPSPAPAEEGVHRTLVIIARAGMGSGRALGPPLLLLVALTLLVLSVGRVSLHPLLGRSRRMEGTVAWFDGTSGYGFIIPDTGTAELFLHRSALSRGTNEVRPGARVSFRTVHGGHRSFALGVREITE